MLIDCQSCVMRDIACSDCVVTMVLGPMPSSLDSHKEALDVLADVGLIAPLLLVKSSDESSTESSNDSSLQYGNRKSESQIGASHQSNSSGSQPLASNL